MRKAVSTIAVSMLALAAEGPAQAEGLSRDMLMGRWCTEGGSYHFTPTDLTVTLDNGRKLVQHIVSFQIEGGDIIVVWREDGNFAVPAERGKGSHTVFTKVTAETMVQASEPLGHGNRSQSRRFRRC